MQRDRTPLFQLRTALLAPMLLVAATAQAEPADWQIDPEHFSIVFGATHAGYEQLMGMFLEGQGTFRYDPETQELSSGRVEVQADSVFTNHDERDDHLTSGDFLSARRNPVIVFQADAFEPRGGTPAQGTVTGSLTLRGETHPVELDVTINKHADYPFGHGQETLGISAQTTISRSQWGMDYGVPDLVGDEVMLRFEFEAIRQ